MKRRMILTIAITTVFVATIGFVKFRQIQAAIAQGASYQPPPEAVTTIVARREPWPESLSAIGTVVAVRGVTVSADLAGVVERIAFESGKRIGAGDLLVALDTRQERAQLAAAEARLDLAELGFERMRGLREKGVVSQAEFDAAAAETKETRARVEEIRATIARKTIRAPFAGSLGIRQVNLGQYLSDGAPIVALQALDPIFVEFSVPQQALGGLAVGAEVRATAEGMAGDPVAGRVSAIDSVVDPATRNARVQATFANADGRLRPGMFLEAQVLGGAAAPVVILPASAIGYAPYGDSVFIVEELKGPNGATYRGVRQQFVKVGPGRGDQVAILSGVEAGQEVVTSGTFKLRNGAAVQIHNEQQPTNNPAPEPEDS